MTKKVSLVVWTRQARLALKAILDYRYKDIPEARKIIRTEIITASKNIVFATQYQEDEVYPQYRKIIIRDYKILYKELEN